MENTQEIKFKFWNEKIKYMTKSISIGDIFYYKDQVLNNEIIKFTNFTDKNNKEIFDGDIIEKHFIKYEVLFYNGSWVVTEIKNFYREQYYFLYLFDKKEIKIIGNIYENKEFLKHKL